MAKTWSPYPNANFPGVEYSVRPGCQDDNVSTSYEYRAKSSVLFSGRRVYWLGCVSPDRGKFFVNFGLLFSSFNRHPCPDEFLHGFQSPITVGKRWDEGEQGNRVPFLSISDSERKAILVHVEGHAVDPACEQCRNPNYLPDGDPDLWFGSCRRMGCWAGCSSCIAKGKGGECSLVG